MNLKNFRKLLFEYNKLMIKIHFQPERSKREDDIMYLWYGICGDYYHILRDPNHIDRCGALNTMET